MHIDNITTSVKRPLKIDNHHSMVEFDSGITAILHVPNSNNLIDVQSVLENMAAVNKLSGNVCGPLLVDFSAFTTVNPLYTPTARTVLLGADYSKRRSAIAFLFNDPEQFQKAFLFHSSNKFSIPLKMFSNRDEALIWLKTFMVN